MLSELDPYRPSISDSPDPRYSLLRSRAADTGLWSVTIVLAIYMFVTVDSDRSPSVILATLNPHFHTLMAILSIAGFVTLSVATLAQQEQRRFASVVRFCIGAAGFATLLWASGFFGLL